MKTDDTLTEAFPSDLIKLPTVWRRFLHGRRITTAAFKVLRNEAIRHSLVPNSYKGYNASRKLTQRGCKRYCDPRRKAGPNATAEHEQAQARGE